MRWRLYCNLWSGRIDELALSFPDSTPQPPARRYGADDYNQFEEDDSGDYDVDEQKQEKHLKTNSNVNVGKVKSGPGGRRATRKQERFEADYDEYDFY